MKTILHAEDDLNDIFIFSRALARAGVPHLYHVVNDGEKAFEWLSGEGIFADRETYPLPDILIVDLKMPKRNGFEVLEWCRQQKEFQLLPILVLSSSDEPRDMKKAYQLGATYCFAKSSSFADIIGYLKEL